MLTLHIGNVKGMERAVLEYFNDVYEEEWFEDPLVRKIIKEVDNNDVVLGCVMYSNEWEKHISPE